MVVETPSFAPINNWTSQVNLCPANVETKPMEIHSWKMS